VSRGLVSPALLSSNSVALIFLHRYCSVHSGQGRFVFERSRSRAEAPLYFPAQHWWCPPLRILFVFSVSPGPCRYLSLPRSRYLIGCPPDFLDEGATYVPKNPFGRCHLFPRTFCWRYFFPLLSTPPRISFFLFFFQVYVMYFPLLTAPSPPSRSSKHENPPGPHSFPYAFCPPSSSFPATELGQYFCFLTFALRFSSPGPKFFLFPVFWHPPRGQMSRHSSAYYTVTFFCALIFALCSFCHPGLGLSPFTMVAIFTGIVRTRTHPVLPPAVRSPSRAAAL